MKPTIEVNLSGENGNIYFLLTIASKAMEGEYGKEDIEEMRNNVFYHAKSHQDALYIIGKYVTIKDTKEDSHKVMIRTEILCPDCMKGKLLTDDFKDAYCNTCGEEFIITAPNTVRYK